MNPIPMIVAFIVTVAVFLLLSATFPAYGSIPPSQEKAPETACEEYLATPTGDRIQQWVATFQNGLVKNPELEQSVWICVMDLPKMIATDQFMVGECSKEKDTSIDFQELAFKALVGHLDQCGISVQRD